MNGSVNNIGISSLKGTSLFCVTYVNVLAFHRACGYHCCHTVAPQAVT